MASGGELSRSVTGASDEYFDYVCSPCEKESRCREAEVFCEDCEEFLCHECLKAHNRFKKMRDNIMLGIDDMKGQGQKKPLPVPTEKCKRHHGVPLDAYCGNHDEMCCAKCVAMKHVSCKGLQYLSDAEEIAASNAIWQLNIGRLDKGPKISLGPCHVVKPGRQYNVGAVDDEDDCSISSICQLKDGTIILADYANNKLKRLDSSYNVFDTLQMRSNPVQICSSGDNELLVAIHDQGEVHAVSTTNTMCLDNILSTGELWCNGVACLEDTIYVTCSNSDKNFLKLFHRNGELIKTIEKDSSSQRLFEYCSYIVASEYERVIFVSVFDNGIIKFDRHGNALARYTDACLENAQNMCVIDKDILLVCDFTLNSVVKLNKSVFTVLIANEDMMKSPTSVFVERNPFRLIVGMDRSSNILVYEMA